MIPEAPVAKPISKSQAERIAQEVFGLNASAQALPGEYDDNFRLETSDGTCLVLKVMHPERSPEFVDLQCSALRHLEKCAPDLILPRVIPSPEGKPFTTMRTGDGTIRLVWILTFLPGKGLEGFRPHSRELLEELGEFLGRMDAALLSFSHPASRRELKWDLSKAGWIREHLECIESPARRALAQRFLGMYEKEVVPKLGKLRRSVIYGDANDHNVLVTLTEEREPRMGGVIDFGDMHYGLTVAEPAVGVAYAILNETEPMEAAVALIRGYHRGLSLKDEETALLYALIGMRLTVSVVNSAYRKTLRPGDDYVTITEEPAWVALERWARIFPRQAHYTFRAACGAPAVPQSQAVVDYLRANSESASPIFDVDLSEEPCLVFDLSAGSKFLGADPRNSEMTLLTGAIFPKMEEAHVKVGVGRYDEARLLYSSALFGKSEDPTGERRTVHLGLDLFVEPGAAIRAPLAGSVHLLANNSAPQDYGPVVVLRHVIGAGTEFFTLYGHLSLETLGKLRAGQEISRGDSFATVGGMRENGGWPPHLHFQIILDLLDFGRDFPGVVKASERPLWRSLSPDPNILLGIPEERFPKKGKGFGATLESRYELLGKNLSVSYRKPLKIVRGWMQFLYDETGRAYLDVYNNVPLVGHCHPRVVRAVQEQIALLNTNTRYLHDNIVEYAERLVRLLPEPLRVCYFLNSGSEANELALRLARTHTGREDVIVLEHAYHGHTNTLIDISPYKFEGPGGIGRKPWVHVAPIPDDYRGCYRRDDPEAGRRYARRVEQICDGVRKQGRGLAAFIAETLPSVAGQIVFPAGYLAETYRHVREAGGVCIADEVQVGFGRLGTHFWGFETQGVAPDIVVLGKPIGNGFPLAAVITTKEIAASFANGMEFFSTFGGNPVACAAGLAVLDVLEDERLQENARRTGDYFKAKLASLQEKHELIGDVRGSGLFLGVDLVRDRVTREAAPAQAAYVVNRLREFGVLTGTDGPHHNVLKLRPPLIFSESDADLFCSTLDAVLNEDPAKLR
ncbi:MAG TPA: aminotransferase class III-fold pyridoxal phosphate-dependent enzyme [Terriglobales bacterium]|nr:aminotransferase class III-fold pyridoxal phosphate-dependent enzyme [Terriglobales bacterium]